ncbi:MAG: 3-methyl-2-oxobutanoate hydroxymethyltransferase [Kiritimatiellia bacterium]|jgi:3-methyl-2-oxobutanoate hydroxymethyltransferase
MKTWTTSKIRQSKGKQKLACLTAYDAATARILDAAGIPLILVGDSVAMAQLGQPNTLHVTMDQMVHHTAAVARGAANSLVVADMPFMSYQASLEQGIGNAGRFLQETDCDAVKLEGGTMRADLVSACVRNGIPVLGHIGLTPQSMLELGGFKVQGRSPDQAEALKADALALAEAGCFAVVLECVPANLAAEITALLPIPTIGIGAGPGCDGQVLVVNDMLGIGDFKPKFVKRYAEIGKAMADAVAAYAAEVQSGAFPTADHCY